MIPLLTLAFLATTTPETGFSSWIRDGEVHVRFYDLSRIYGPFKFYVSAAGIPAAGCATCPIGVTPDIVVPPERVHQKWPPGAPYVEASFPLSAVGDLQFFYFTAVTLVPGEERFLAVGYVPHRRGT